MSERTSNFEVFPDNLGSDPAPIICEVNVKKSRIITNKRVKELRFNFKKANRNDYREIINSELVSLT